MVEKGAGPFVGEWFGQKASGGVGIVVVDLVVGGSSFGCAGELFCFQYYISGALESVRSSRLSSD